MPQHRTDTLNKTLGSGRRPVDERLGHLQVRLAESEEEIHAALRLRYRVFYEEMSAKPSPEVAASREDFDEFDPYCEHLLVIDRERGDGPDGIVGTYRMMRREGADNVGRFYTSDEYDISGLLERSGTEEILEMGRSCIAADYRTRSAMQLLWKGVTAYVLSNRIQYLFGCASLRGTDPQALALPLAYLYHNHLAAEDLRPVAVPDRFVDMNLMAPEAIDAKTALRHLPPIIKGYLRLGGVVGDGAVVDYEFGTVDVCVIVQTDKVTEKYFKHYTRDIGGNE